MTKLGNVISASTALWTVLLSGRSAPITVADSPASIATISTPAPTPSVPTKPRIEQIDHVNIGMIQKDNPGLTVADPSSMITVGKGFCSMKDGGAARSDINSYILTAAGPGYTVVVLSSMNGAAVGAYCTEHLDELG